ncbi:MAG TPA: ABC transporter permease [Chloroflexota bacterium]|nr:ABC transporter permease [Chloroflexota bacterium]
MIVFLVRRFFGLIFVLFAVTFMTFLIGHAAPGDPIQIILGFHYDPATYQRLRHFYGLDQPLLQQYIQYVWHIVRYWNFGYSYQYGGRPVSTILGTAMPVTFTIGLSALGLAVLVGVPVGVYAAARRNQAGDRISMTAMLVLYSIPSFVLIPLVIGVDIWLEQHRYPSLPVANWGTVQQAILPVLVLSAGTIAYIARLTRTTMVGMLREDFIRTARAKGLTRRRIVLGHALRPALLPVVTFLGPAIAGLVTGTFVVENIFNLPGVGFAAVQSIESRDYPVVQGATIVVAVIVVLMNLLADILYRVLDPRIQE